MAVVAASVFVWATVIQEHARISVQADATLRRMRTPALSSGFIVSATSYLRDPIDKWAGTEHSPLGVVDQDGGHAGPENPPSFRFRALQHTLPVTLSQWLLSRYCF